MAGIVHPRILGLAQCSYWYKLLQTVYQFQFSPVSSLNMFTITSVTVSGTSRSYIILGGQPGKEVIGPVSPFGPQGSVYQLCIPGLGFIKFTDVGPKVSGPGDWAVQFASASATWNYSGGGEAKIAIDNAGNFTVSGGANNVTGKVTPW
ncbi:hypothetical protein D9756_010557 [Leucocoprinus leucothites]|uniref:Uncharacterized protein n=1 Tax=Leucocoprinus leucothites TaxID=201217 RepID=A0A8H5CSM0_9AGAR|nr:hypothetical protein D9756_010557 [Leucoagaricus leucothites]